MSGSTVFEDVTDLPDPAAESALTRLVGLDDHIDRLVKEALLLIDPSRLEEWSKTHHGRRVPVLDVFARRPPLFILAGDVGTGKSTVARAFGSRVASQSKVAIQLFAMSLNTRGSGAVGEMTRLLSTAFQEVVEAAGKRKADGKSSRGIVLLIDEADSLAQSREASQMHHEDRAGVNALIRGIDHIADRRLPVAVVMCTNRLEALDPAVRRRASVVLSFGRPDLEQRVDVFERGLEGLSFSHADCQALAQATGENDGRQYGFTYSDLTQRLLPALVLDAFPNRPIDPRRALDIARTIVPTPPFREQTFV